MRGFAYIFAKVSLVSDPVEARVSSASLVIFRGALANFFWCDAASIAFSLFLLLTSFRFLQGLSLESSVFLESFLRQFKVGILTKLTLILVDKAMVCLEFGTPLGFWIAQLLQNLRDFTVLAAVTRILFSIFSLLRFAALCGAGSFHWHARVVRNWVTWWHGLNFSERHQMVNVDKDVARLRELFCEIYTYLSDLTLRFRTEGLVNLQGCPDAAFWYLDASGNGISRSELDLVAYREHRWQDGHPEQRSETQ